MLGFITMLALWRDAACREYWVVGLGWLRADRRRLRFRLCGHPGVALAHWLGAGAARTWAWRRAPPTSSSATSAGAIMQSILGALLTAGYAAAMTKDIGSSPNAPQVTSSTQSTLTKSFASAANLASQYPQYAKQITAAAQQSFVDGQDWAYVAGIVAIALGAALVFFMFPKHDHEIELLAEYGRGDAEVGSTT